MKCIAYYRFSTLGQDKGSSIERQEANCRAFAKAQGWEIVETIIDKGKSAYTGDHLAVGELGDFTERVRQGQYRDGYVILAEHPDRFSRQDRDTRVEWSQEIIKGGVAIATSVDGRIRLPGVQRNLVDAVLDMFEAEAAHAESAKKSERLRKAFAGKRARLSEGHTMTSMTPPWVQIVDGRRVNIPERVSIVQEIFAWSDEGHGRAKIAKMLNERGTEYWSRREVERASGWYPSIIANILRNSAVIGEYQPMTRIGKEERAAKGEKQRVAIGDVITDYYEPIIDADVFARVNDRHRLASMKSKGTKAGEIANVLAGLVKCQCGARMEFRRRIQKGDVINKPRQGGSRRTYVAGGDESYLVCNHSQRGQCTLTRKYRYEFVLKALLDQVLVLSMDDTQFTSDADIKALTTRLAELKIKHDRASEVEGRFLKLFGETGKESVRAQWSAASTNTEALKAEMDQAQTALNEASAAVNPEVHINRVNEVRALLNDDDDAVRFGARSKVMEALRSTLEGVYFNGDISYHRWSAVMKGDMRRYYFSETYEPTTSIPFDLLNEAMGLSVPNVGLAIKVQEREGNQITEEEREAMRRLLE